MRNPVDVASGTTPAPSLTTLPLLAWRPSDCSTRYVYISSRYIELSPRETPPRRSVGEVVVAAVAEAAARTRKRDRVLSGATPRGAARNETAGLRAQVSLLPMYGGRPSLRIRTGSRNRARLNAISRSEPTRQLHPDRAPRERLSQMHRHSRHPERMVWRP